MFNENSFVLVFDVAGVQQRENWILFWVYDLSKDFLIYLCDILVGWLAKPRKTENWHTVKTFAAAA